MYNFKTKNLKYNMHNSICITSEHVIASIDQFDLVLVIALKVNKRLNKETEQI